MKRREFLKGSLLASSTVGFGYALASEQRAEAASQSGEGRDFYELREYRLKPVASHEVLDGYLATALIPALNRLGVTSVGAFTEPEAKDGPAVWVLIPYPSAEMFAGAAARVNADPGYQKAGAAYLHVNKAEAAFDRIDSWLLLGFTGMPRLELPALTREKKARVFEMRTYESYSEAKALKKIEMFNSGEIEVMKEVKLSPVFYGQALAGRDLPHLTYMLCGEDRALHKQHFDSFLKHPTWNRLKNDPQYADTVSKITSRFLTPLPYSQI
jgi:NIPSNAP protein